MLPTTCASSISISIRSWYGVEHPEDTKDGSLDEWMEGKGLRPRTSLLLDRMRPNQLSIPMLVSEGIAGKRF